MIVSLCRVIYITSESMALSYPVFDLSCLKYYVILFIISQAHVIISLSAPLFPSPSADSLCSSFQIMNSQMAAAPLRGDRCMVRFVTL